MLGLKRLAALVVVLAAFLSLPVGADAEYAQDITKQCKITTRIGSKQIPKLFDNKYKTVFSSGTGNKAGINVVLPKGETAGGVYIKWSDHSIAVRIQVPDGNDFETIATCDTPFLCDYIVLPENVTSFQIIQDEGAKGRMYISELRIYSQGEIPEDVQQWDMPLDKCDLLVISTHPDDELIFMGGTIPYYAAQERKAVQVAYIVPATPNRRLELLDGLWHCGVTHYPDIGNFKDAFANSKEKLFKSWSKDRLLKHVAGLYRRYRPEVVVTHDVFGEYGHGAHIAVSYAAQEAVKNAANPKYDPKALEPWQISKLYLHLYDKNRIDMDWRVPLDAFDGKTAFDIAAEAFQKHVSQINRGYYEVEDFGPYDNSEFGLYFTTVGTDEEKNDFFEHIPSN